MSEPSRSDPEVLLEHAAYVRALARALVFDPSLAKDVEQETWLATLAQAPRDPSAARGWLASIVRNLAHKALRSAGRRRGRETHYARTASEVPTPAEVLEREDLRRGVVELVNSLDEPYRAALVLRYLEGCEPREVARRLGVPLGTAKTRLKRGLDLLRARLDSSQRGGRESWCLAFVHGFGLGPPGLASLVGISASALLQCPSGVLALTVMKTTAVASAVLAIGASVFVLVRTAESRTPEAGPGPASTERVASTPAGPESRSTDVEAPQTAAPRTRPSASISAVEQASTTKDTGLVTVTGRVVGPDGAPRGGSEVFLSRAHFDDRYPRDPIAAVTAAEDGTFALTYSKSDARFKVDAERVEMWRHVTVATHAVGFGPAWVDLDRHPDGTPVELQLVPDLPLRGRVVDLEGQPIQGVRVDVSNIGATSSGSLDGFLADPLNEEPSAYLAPLPAHAISAVTDDEGAFVLMGVGAERLVRLMFTGETVVCTRAEVLTREFEEREVVLLGRRLLGSGFAVSLSPTRPILGIVRDRETGAPLADVTVMSQRMAGRNFFDDSVRTKSGPDGRFRLVGMPKGPGNELCVVPSDASPYMIEELGLPDPGGMAPIEVEIGLVRGVWITGRVTDASGAPVYGRLHYLPFLENPTAQALYGNRNTDSLPGVAVAQNHYKTDADGRFRLVGLPGRAVVGVETFGQHRRGVGAAEIGGIDERGNLATFANPIYASTRWPTSMRLIDPAVGTAEVSCDLVVDTGDTLEIRLVDGAGQPVEGCLVRGASRHFGPDVPSGASIAILSVGPDERRLLRIHHPSRCIGRAIHVTLADGPKELVLAPCTTLIGRLVDDAGAGVGGVVVRAESGLHFDAGPGCETAADGSFRLEHLVPDLAFELLAEGEALRDRLQTFAVPIELRGGVVDLGTLTVTLR